MKVMVVYASRYGSTKAIAEFIAEKLRQQGVAAEARSANTAPYPTEFDAVVIGSAVYLGHWMEEAVKFVQRSRTALTNRPVWLFSSGPLKLSPEIISVQDPKLEPKEIGEFRELIHPNDHRIFSGALNPAKLGLAHKMLRKLPAARAILTEGDFRDWNDIEGWSISIARVLATHQ